jgi:hypothetical protein
MAAHWQPGDVPGCFALSGLRPAAPSTTRLTFDQCPTHECEAPIGDQAGAEGWGERPTLP